MIINSCLSYQCDFWFSVKKNFQEKIESHVLYFVPLRVNHTDGMWSLESASPHAVLATKTSVRF